MLLSIPFLSKCWKHSSEPVTKQQLKCCENRLSCKHIQQSINVNYTEDILLKGLDLHDILKGFLYKNLIALYVEQIEFRLLFT